MRAEGKSSITAEKMADAVLAELDLCMMSHKCNDVFVEFGLYYTKIRLVMAKINCLEDKQKLADDFVWKQVKAKRSCYFQSAGNQVRATGEQHA